MKLGTAIDLKEAVDRLHSFWKIIRFEYRRKDVYG